MNRKGDKREGGILDMLGLRVSGMMLEHEFQ